MRNIKFDNQTISNLPKLGIITSIVELSSHDFIYIKNKLKSGDEITFIEDGFRSWDPKAIAVYFKGYKLGYLSFAIKNLVKKACLNNGYSKGVIQINSKNNAGVFNNIDLLIEIH
jgi:hypothetical protein